MPEATYTGLDGEKFTVTYDERAPCIVCNLPVVMASMGGTAVCPWCDVGVTRDGRKWTGDDFRMRRATAEERAQGKAEMVQDLRYKATPEEYARAVAEYWPNA